MNRVATAVLVLTLTLVVASPAFAQEGEPGDAGPDVPLHIEHLLCPLSPRGPEGCITQGFHARHRGIDVSLWGGTPISATHAGTVAGGGWVGGHFGNLIIIRRKATTRLSSPKSRRSGNPGMVTWIRSWYSQDRR